MSILRSTWVKHGGSEPTSKNSHRKENPMPKLNDLPESPSNPTPSEIAFRLYADVQPDDRPKKAKKDETKKNTRKVSDSESSKTRKPFAPHIPKPWNEPEYWIVFDTETRIDETQRLLFGGYRIYRNRMCVEVGLFYGDDIEPKELETLRKYVSDHEATVDRGGNPDLQIISRRGDRRQ